MKVLIIGLGSIAKKHISVLFDINPRTEIFALRKDKNAQSVENVVNIYDLGEIPVDIDFAIISNPTSKHAGSIKDLLEFGFPLFIEKPLFSEISDFNFELVREINEKEILTYLACNFRFHPCINFLKKEFALRKPIEYNSYCGSYLPNWRPDQDYSMNYSAKKELGGGVHLDLIHEVDFCYYLLGGPQNILSYRHTKSNLRINSSDIAHYVFDYPATTAFITLNYYRRDAKRFIECVWEDETWHVNILTNTITNQLGEIIFKEDFNLMKTYRDQMAHFIHCVENKQPSMNDINQGWKILNISLHE